MILFANTTKLTANEAARSLARLDIEEFLLPILIQLAVIIAVARLFGFLARKVNQPSVIGEILAGLVLGPSFVGWLFPEYTALIFSPHLSGVPDALSEATLPKIIQVIAQLGLIFLLFLIGLEFEFRHLHVKGRAALTVSLNGILVPFVLGLGLAMLIHPYLEPHPAAKGQPVPLTSLMLFLGVAMSITAIPMLGRMMLELGITRTQLGAVVLTAAAISDAFGWILLAAVAALAKSEFEFWAFAKMILLTLGFLALVFLVIRPALTRYFRWSLRNTDGVLSLNALALLLVVLLLCAIATSTIGIFAIFGAFILGAALSDQQELREAVTLRLRDLVIAFFLPVFFAYTGLRTELSGLGNLQIWLIIAAVTLTAILSKMLGCGIAARMTGYSTRESVIIGALMNTRGLMALIVINVGFDLGVIPRSLFSVLVVTAVITTVMTTPIVLRLRYGTELEEPIRRSGFLGPVPPESRPELGIEPQVSAHEQLR